MIIRFGINKKCKICGGIVGCNKIVEYAYWIGNQFEYIFCSEECTHGFLSNLLDKEVAGLYSIVIKRKLQSPAHKFEIQDWHLRNGEIERFDTKSSNGSVWRHILLERWRHNDY